MSAGEIDQISMMLGAMQSDIREGVKQRKSMDEKLDHLLNVLPIIAEMRKEMDEDVLPVIKDWHATKHKTAGIALGVGAGAGLGSAGLFPMIKTAILKVLM